MQFQIIETNWGGEIAVHDGHSYNQKQTTINYIHWSFTKIYQLKCPAIMKTKPSIVETKCTHNHDYDPRECESKEVVNQTKRIAQNSTSSVCSNCRISVLQAPPLRKCYITDAEYPQLS